MMWSAPTTADSSGSLKTSDVSYGRRAHQRLQTRVGRRIFLLFFLCALIPIGALAALSYYHVARQLRDQGQQRIQQAIKSVGMGIMERLSLAEAELKVLGATLLAAPRTPDPIATAGLELGVRFGAVALAREGEGLVSFYGEMENPARVLPWKQSSSRTAEPYSGLWRSRRGHT